LVTGEARGVGLIECGQGVLSHGGRASSSRIRLSYTRVFHSLSACMGSADIEADSVVYANSAAREKISSTCACGKLIRNPQQHRLTRFCKHV
jgi:hypothetical protein